MAFITMKLHMQPKIRSSGSEGGQNTISSYSLSCYVHRSLPGFNLSSAVTREAIFSPQNSKMLGELPKCSTKFQNCSTCQVLTPTPIHDS